MLKQIQNKDELLAQTQEELRTFKRKSETIGKETCLKKIGTVHGRIFNVTKKQ